MNPVNDYTGGPELLYKTWGPLMPLRWGFQPGKVIPESRWRQVFMFHDNRFSQNRTMLYHVANTLMRHAVNKTVSVTMRTNANAFEKLQLLINSPDFMSKLRAAKANPDGVQVAACSDGLGDKVVWRVQEHVVLLRLGRTASG